MQSRKRAKPVKFGKTSPKVEKEEAAPVVVEEKPVGEVVQTEKEAVTEPVIEHEEPKPWGTVLPNNEEPKEYQPQDSVLSAPDASVDEEVAPSSAVVPEVKPEIEVAKEEEKPGVDEQWPFPSKEKHHGLFTYFLLVTLVAFLLGLAFIAGAYYALHRANFALPFLSKTAPTPTPKPTAIPILTPTPVASKSANLSQNTIAVLNGSGITGQAAKVK